MLSPDVVVHMKKNIAEYEDAGIMVDSRYAWPDAGGSVVVEATSRHYDLAGRQRVENSDGAASLAECSSVEVITPLQSKRGVLVQVASVQPEYALAEATPVQPEYSVLPEVAPVQPEYSVLPEVAPVQLEYSVLPEVAPVQLGYALAEETSPQQEYEVVENEDAEVVHKSNDEEPWVNEPWYHGMMARATASDLLRQQSGGEDGWFLVRQSPRVAGLFAISLTASQHLHHFSIQHSAGTFLVSFAGVPTRRYSSLKQIVAYHTKVAGGLPVCLQHIVVDAAAAAKRHQQRRPREAPLHKDEDVRSTSSVYALAWQECMLRTGVVMYDVAV